MKGFILSYKPRDELSRVKLNHALFGRIIYRNYRGKKYAYYAPGLLDEVKFSRLAASKIFVTQKIGVKEIKEFGEVTLEDGERDDSLLLLVTGQEHWSRVAAEKGLFFKKGGKR